MNRFVMRVVITAAFSHDAPSTISRYCPLLYWVNRSPVRRLTRRSSPNSDPAGLKLIVMAVNREPDIVAKEDFLSDSVYKYNARTNTLSVWDSEGFFHDDRLSIA